MLEDLIVIVGRMCSGKTTLKNEFIRQGRNPIITATTRPPREGEVDGEDYYFVSEDKFFALAGEGSLFETAYFNVFTPGKERKWYYGTPVDDLFGAINGVIILSPEGVYSLYEKGARPIVMWVDAPEHILYKRAIERGDDPREVKRRLESEREQFSQFHKSGLARVRIATNLGDSTTWEY